MKKSRDFYRGCLIGGAVGDALGWPVEFLSLDDIRKKYRKNGITELHLGAKGKAEITDDTQMTLFTAEGILRWERMHKEGKTSDLSSVVYFAYQRWLYTQGYPKNKNFEWIYEGWLLDVKDLYQKRAPGISCISALLSGKQGSVKSSINNSKGCGGVMRVAPIGLYYSKKEAFKVAVDCAAITHGHPSGYLSAGAFAYIIACIIEGVELEAAVEEAASELKNYKRHEECASIIKKAVNLANSDIDIEKAIKEIGEGWVGEEALAISIYCALKHSNDYRKAICASVNHDGDSDSTGSITGNILGAYLGLNKIPKAWIEKVELTDVINQIADELLIGYNGDKQ